MQYRRVCHTKRDFRVSAARTATTCEQNAPEILHRQPRGPLSGERLSPASSPGSWSDTAVHVAAVLCLALCRGVYGPVAAVYHTQAEAQGESEVAEEAITALVWYMALSAFRML